MTPKEAFQRIELVIELADNSVNTNTATGRELEDAIIRITDEIKLVRQSLTELERLKVFKKTFDNYELSKKQDFIAYENWQECEAFIAKTIAILKSRIGLNLHIIESEPISKQDKNNLLAENIGIEFAIMLLEDTD